MGTAFSSGFGAGVSLGAVKNKQEELKFLKQQELRKAFVENVKLSTDQMVESVKNISPAIFSADSPEEKAANQLALDTANGETFKSLGLLSQQALKSGIATESEVQNIMTIAQQASKSIDPKFAQQQEAQGKAAVAGAEASAKVPAAVSQAQQKSNTSAEIVNFVDPSNGDRFSARKGSSKAEELSKQGFIRDKRSEVITGTPDQFGEDTEGRQNRKEFREAIENNNLVHVTGNRIKSLLSEQGATRGALAGIINFAEGFKDQIRQIKGVEIFSSGDSVNSSILATEESGRLNSGIRAAMINGKVDARIVSLAFMLAQVNNPDGRISDQDFNTASKMIRGESASIPSIISAIDEVMLLSDDRLNAKKDAFNAVGFGVGEPTDAPIIIDFNSLPE